jgi:hypothetical protein
MGGESSRSIQWGETNEGDRLTLGNQFGGKDQVFEEELVERFNVR